MRRFIRVIAALAATLVAPAVLAAQAAGPAPLDEAQLYSLYARRHTATIQLAELATAGTTDGEVRKVAESLARDHREARAKLERLAAEHHLTLTPSGRDTTDALLQSARSALAGRTGRDFDSTWAALAHGWLSTLVLDNNRNVKPRLAGADLSGTARDHSTWLFHQMVDLDRLRKKLRST